MFKKLTSSTEIFNNVIQLNSICSVENYNTIFKLFSLEKKIFITLLLLMFPITAHTQWERTGGPEGATISSLATINGTIYAGTKVNGIYVSTDDGISWGPRNTSIETLEVTSIVKKPGYIFAGTFGGGVYRSTDGGQTWLPPSNGTDFAVTSMVIDDEYIFAGTISDGGQRSSDNGVTWTEKLPDLFGVGAMCKSGNKVIASVSNYTLESSDHGETWSYISALDGAIIFTYYCEGNNIYAGGQNKLYRSTDNGNTFTTINLNFTFGIVNVYAIVGNELSLFAATSYDGVYESTDYGTTWFSANSGMGPKDARALTITGSSTLIAGTHYVGMYRSTNLGLSWNKSVSGFPAGLSILALMDSKSSVFAGTRDGVYRTDDNGDSWTKLTADNDTINYSQVWTLCELDGVIYASMQLYFNTSIYRTTNSGENWIRCSGIGLPPGSLFIKALVASGENIVAGTDEGVYYSSDKGETWNQTNLLNINIPSLAVSGNFVYAAVPSGFGVYRSADNGVSWTLSLQSTVDYVEVAALDNYAYAGSFFGGARYSSNNGSTWSVSSGFPADASVFVLQPVSDGVVLAGTDLAPDWIYSSSDYGVSFSPFSEELAVRASVEAFAVNDTFMFAGTDDHGVWRRFRPGVVNVQTHQNMPRKFYLAQNFPNPFNPSTTIEYSLPESGNIKLEVYNSLGEEVATLVNDYKEAGIYKVKFDARNLASGIYLYKIDTGNYSSIKKMILLR